MRIRTTNWDAIAASVPLNRTASIVRDGSGDVFTPRGDLDAHRHWAFPPPQVDEPRPATEDLTGRKFGRLTVIRFHSYGHGGKNGLPTWLVRCVCGDYEARRAKKLKANQNPDECCVVCARTKALQALTAKPSTKRDREKAGRRLDTLAAKTRAA